MDWVDDQLPRREYMTVSNMRTSANINARQELIELNVRMPEYFCSDRLKRANWEHMQISTRAERPTEGG